MDLSLELARRRVARYRSADDDLMARHHDAMMCRDREEWIARGLEAYQAICNADSTFRQAAIEGIEVPDDIPTSLRYIYEQWLEMEPSALEAIEAFHQRGFNVEREAEFRAACDDVRRKLSVEQLHDVLDDVAEGRVFTFTDVPPPIR